MKLAKLLILYLACITGISVVGIVALTPGVSYAQHRPPPLRPSFRVAAQPKVPLRNLFRNAVRGPLPKPIAAKGGGLTNNFKLQAVRPITQRPKLSEGLRKRIFSPAKVNSGKLTIGSYPRYTQYSSKNGTRHFQIPKHIYNKMSKTERWRANKKFLDRSIRRNNTILLSNHAKTAIRGSGFAREIAYLRSRGYRSSQDGFSMVRGSARAGAPPVKSQFNLNSKIGSLSAKFRTAAKQP